MKKNVSNYMHEKIIKFNKDIKDYQIPVGFRMFENKDLYKVAKQELDAYFNGKLSLKEIAHPDCILRNVMLLWPIDKKKLSFKH